MPLGAMDRFYATRNLERAEVWKRSAFSSASSSGPWSMGGTALSTKIGRLKATSRRKLTGKQLRKLGAQGFVSTRRCSVLWGMGGDSVSSPQNKGTHVFIHVLYMNRGV